MTRTFIGRFWPAAALAIAAFACGSNGGGGFPGGGGATQGSDAGGAAASSSSSSGGSGDSDGTGAGDMSGFSAGDSGGSTGGNCQAGLYSGTFSCFFYYGSDAGIGDAPDSGGLGPITGTMSFMLTQNYSVSGEGTGTDTASGTFDATTGLIIAAAADLTGTLECEAGSFTGDLVNGVYGFNLNGMPVPDPNNKFQGPLTSEYDGKTATFTDGKWSMYIAGEGPCIGTWTATYAGPGDGGAADQ